MQRIDQGNIELVNNLAYPPGQKWLLYNYQWQVWDKGDNSPFDNF